MYVLIADQGVLTAEFGSLVRAIDSCTGDESVFEERA